MKLRAILILITGILTFLLLVPMAIGILHTLYQPEHGFRSIHAAITHFVEVTLAIGMVIASFYYGLKGAKSSRTVIKKSANDTGSFENTDLFFNQQ